MWILIVILLSGDARIGFQAFKDQKACEDSVAWIKLMTINPLATRIDAKCIYDRDPAPTHVYP
jgi:hypothetical protein